MKKSIIIMLLISVTPSLLAQSTYIDSLQKVLAVSKADTNRILLLQKLANQYAFQQSDSALIYADSGIQLSKELKYIKGEALCLMAKATYYRISGASVQGMYYAMKALPLFEKQQDLNNIIVCNLLISWTLEDQQYPRLCINYILKVVPTAMQIKSIWLGFCYATLCINYSYLNMLDSALIFGLRADTLMRGNDFNIASIGDIYLKMNNISEAEKYLNRVIAIYDNKRDISSRAYNALSNFYYQKNHIDSAIYFAKKVLPQDQNQKYNITRELETAAAMLKELYQKKGLRDSVFFYMQTLIALKDKLSGQEKTNLISLLFNEQSQRQEIETRQLQYEKRVQIFSLLAVLSIFLLISLVLYRHDRQKQKANKILKKTLTELKSTQSQLIQSEKMASLGELTSGIAHEIQNPLNFVNNFSEVNSELLQEMKAEIVKGNLSEANNIANDLIENEQKINHHGKRAESIVKGMLEHSRTNSGQKEATDINALADEYLRLSYHGIRARNKLFNATIETDFDSSIGKINIIPQDIGRVLLNLYNNAFYAVNEKKKTAEGEYEPSVSLHTKKEANKVVISVKDNGKGIPQNIIDKIFQPFFTTKPTGQGTGLGLSLAYDIVKAHGGEIFAESCGKAEIEEGKGSIFIIHLPAI